MPSTTINPQVKSHSEVSSKSGQFSIFSLPLMEVAEILLNIGAVKLNVNEPFEWASGIKSPIYCDNRIINSRVEARDAIVGIATHFVWQNFPDVEIIAGVSTGGIPLGSLIADRMKLPFIYVRGEAKKHGLRKQVEGIFGEGNRVLLFEDHISTGGSSMVAVEALRKVGLEVVCLLSIMTYGFETMKQSFVEKNILHYSLCDLDLILETAVKKGTLMEGDKKEVLEFKKSPNTWFDNKK